MHFATVQLYVIIASIAIDNENITINRIHVFTVVTGHGRTIRIESEIKGTKTKLKNIVFLFSVSAANPVWLGVCFRKALIFFRFLCGHVSRDRFEDRRFSTTTTAGDSHIEFHVFLIILNCDNAKLIVDCQFVASNSSLMFFLCSFSCFDSSPTVWREMSAIKRHRRVTINDHKTNLLSNRNNKSK